MKPGKNMSLKSNRCSSNRCWSLAVTWSLGLIGCVLLGSGCTHVNPWERDALADPVMRTDRDPAGTLLSEHMWFSREAASGGRGVGGGGCGCN